MTETQQPPWVPTFRTAPLFQAAGGPSGLQPGVFRGSGLHTAVILLWGGRLIKNQEPHLGTESWAGSLARERERLGQDSWGEGRGPGEEILGEGVLEKGSPGEMGPGEGEFWRSWGGGPGEEVLGRGSWERGLLEGSPGGTGPQGVLKGL